MPWRRLKDERGGLWAAAVELYRQGEQWEYSSGQLAQLAKYQDEFLERDSWFECVSNYVSDKEMMTTADILRNAIDIDLDKTNNGHQRRVGRVMRAMGWEYTTRKVNGKSVRVWLRTSKAEPINDDRTEY